MLEVHAELVGSLLRPWRDLRAPDIEEQTHSEVLRRAAQLLIATVSVKWFEGAIRSNKGPQRFS